MFGKKYQSSNDIHYVFVRDFCEGFITTGLRFWSMINTSHLAISVKCAL